MTELLYLEKPNLFLVNSTLLSKGVDEKGKYLVLDKTIFYPQGGGQPADRGTIKADSFSFDVIDVRKVEGAVHHYIKYAEDSKVFEEFSKQTTSKPNISVVLKVDNIRRNINAKYHTAGHLIASVAEKLDSSIKAIKGHHFPGEAYVEFDGVLENVDFFTEALKAEIGNAISENKNVVTSDLELDVASKLLPTLLYSLPKNKKLRICTIEGFEPAPCGGTHVSNLQEIGVIEIAKCKSKKGKTKVRYEVSSTLSS